MIKITYPDRSVKEFNEGVTPIGLANMISPSLAKKVIVAKINGEFKDVTYPITEDCDFELVTGYTEGLNDILNHSCAHLLAQAIRELYPSAMFGVGPAIEEGFYYDMDLGGVKLNEEDLKAIEKKMAALSAQAFDVRRMEMSKEEALAHFEHDKYKTELINELPVDAVISVYGQGNFYDLCRGPHVSNTNF